MIGIYLNFAGNCKDALDTYEKAFVIKATEVAKYGEMPPDPNFPVAEKDKELILHSKLTIDGVEIMCSDTPQRAVAGNNTYIAITLNDEKFIKKA
jgi:PhnB protein